MGDDARSLRLSGYLLARAGRRDEMPVIPLLLGGDVESQSTTPARFRPHGDRPGTIGV